MKLCPGLLAPLCGQHPFVLEVVLSCEGEAVLLSLANGRLLYPLSPAPPAANPISSSPDFKGILFSLSRKEIPMEMLEATVLALHQLFSLSSFLDIQRGVDAELPCK